MVDYSGIVIKDDEGTILAVEAEPQPGDITLDTADEQVTETRIAPLVDQPEIYMNPILWGAYELADWMTPSVELTEDRVQYKTAGRSDKWTYTGQTPEQYTTSQKLYTQDKLHQELRNPSTSAARQGELMDLLGGTIPTVTTDQDSGGGGLFDGLGDLFGGLSGQGDWWKYIVYAVIAIVVIVVILAVVK